MSSGSSVSWLQVAARVWGKAQAHDVFGMSAQIAYYTLLALFPLLILLTSAFGLMARTGSEAYENLLSYARQMLPYEAFTLVVNTLKEIQQGAGGFKIGVGVLGTLWAASSGTTAIINGLNRAYDTKETRPWWKSASLSVGLTVFLSLFAITATVLVLYGGRSAELIAGYFGLETIFTQSWNVLQWPVALLILYIGLWLMYRFGPNTGQQRHKVWPGAIAGMILWLLVSLVLRLYLQFFNSYNKTYGSLGAVIILLLWFYLSGVAILLGGELNSELEKAASAVQAAPGETLPIARSPT